MFGDFCDSNIYIYIFIPQSFINQKRKETEDEDLSESFMQKHEQKIRHFGEYAFSNILQFRFLQYLCRFSSYSCTERNNLKDCLALSYDNK